MKYVLGTACMASFVAGMASAGGIERYIPSYAPLFESGNYLEFSFRNTTAEVSGSHPAALAARAGSGRDTGDMAKSETQFGLAAKVDLSDSLSFGFFMTQPYGARADYTEGVYAQLPAAGTTTCPAILGGGTCVASGSTNLTADWNSVGYEAVLRYKFSDRASVYGGLRAVTSKAKIGIPIQLVSVSSGGALPGDYFADSSTETDLGFIIGAAYEIPDIAARVALTYRSEIEHEFSVRETGSVTLSPTAIPGVSADVPLLDAKTKTKVKMPQSVTIDFQTGVAPGTLVFGSARWTEWSKWEVRTEAYEAATGGEITGFDNDTWTFNLGVGRQINENFSVFASAGYEAAKGGDASRLAPTDGYTSIAVGGRYRFNDGTTVRAGLQHAWLGDAETSDGTKFTGNTALGFGLNVGFAF